MPGSLRRPQRWRRYRQLTRIPCYWLGIPFGSVRVDQGPMQRSLPSEGNVEAPPSQSKRIARAREFVPGPDFHFFVFALSFLHNSRNECWGISGAARAAVQGRNGSSTVPSAPNRYISRRAESATRDRNANLPELIMAHRHTLNPIRSDQGRSPALTAFRRLCSK
jgi:hypothetical protein